MATLPHPREEPLAFLEVFCPVYRDHLRRFPEGRALAEDALTSDASPTDDSFIQAAWETLAPASDAWEPQLAALRRLRRQISLRLALRDLARHANLDETLGGLSDLARFCIASVESGLRGRWIKRCGTPWDEELDRPARFCVIGMGKLGGGELNFCSDVDLVYVYEGNGHCKRESGNQGQPNATFYARLGKEIANALRDHASEGFLYNVDLRLRPEGSTGPLVRNFASTEAYYAAAGQTWERLAWQRAVPIAGDIELGEELLEALHAFRYPRRPPAGLLEEIAGVKLRMEREVLGSDGCARDIKNGHGGIREVEFVAQALQMIHAGRNPFLQTPSTRQALAQLQRYGFLKEQEEAALQRHYAFLRRVENCLQMRDERQMHALPEDDEDWELLARALTFDSTAAFQSELKDVRAAVREVYREVVPESTLEAELQAWTLFLSGKDPGEGIRQRLRGWFWGPLGPVEEGLRAFVRGSAGGLLTREQVKLMLTIKGHFDEALKPLAHPLRTLERINAFAAAYGARLPFLKLCAQRPEFFKAICLLFDRSRFVHEFVCKHPEVIEEIFLTGPRIEKPRPVMEREIAHLPHADDNEAAHWIWMYARAELVRMAVNEVLGAWTLDELEDGLTQLAECLLARALALVGGEERLLVVALGKLGASEMTFGSDLDLIVLTDGEGGEEPARLLRRMLSLISKRFPGGRAFETDLRLRPFGDDGPLVSTFAAWEDYHRKHAGAWERNALLRARPIAGPRPWRERFSRWRMERLFEAAVSEADIEELSRMRDRILREKVSTQPPELAFKAGPGGIIDVEFFAREVQLRYGHAHEILRACQTRAVLRAGGDLGLIPRQEAQRLLEHYDFLRMVELCERRRRNTPVTEVSQDPDERHSIAIWMGSPDWGSFQASYVQRLRSARERIDGIRAAPSNSLTTTN